MASAEEERRRAWLALQNRVAALEWSSGAGGGGPAAEALAGHVDRLADELRRADERWRAAEHASLEHTSALGQVERRVDVLSAAPVPDNAHGRPAVDAGQRAGSPRQSVAAHGEHSHGL